MAPLLGLGVLVALHLREALVGARILYYRDIGLVWWVQMATLIRCLATGAWPVWDPYRGFGQPLLAEPSAQVLYPFTWLTLLVPGASAYTLFAALHLVGSGWGASALARRWGASPGAAFVAAAAWTGSGPLLSLVSLNHHLAGAAWMPWVLLASEHALASARRVKAAILGVVFALQILAGSADMCAMTGLLMAAQWLRAFDWKRPLGRPNRRLLGSGALALLLALALSSPLWLSALDMARRSERWDLAESARTMWSVHPVEWLQGLAPLSLNRLPLLPQHVATVLDNREPFLASFYLGLPALALVLAALASSGPRRGFLAAAALIAVLVALGRHTPAYAALVTALPLLRILRYPSKATLALALAWSLLAGIGFDRIRTGHGTSQRRWILTVLLPFGVVVMAVLAAALAGMLAAEHVGPLVVQRDPGVSYAQVLERAAHSLALSGALAAFVWLLLAFGGRRGLMAPALAGLLALCVIGDLSRVHADLQDMAPRELFTHRPDALRALAGDPHQRLYAYNYRYDVSSLSGPKPAGFPPPQASYRLKTVPEGWTPRQAIFLALQMSLHPPAAGRWGIYGSYDFDLLGLYPKHLSEMVMLLRKLEATSFHLRLLQMGAVSHVVALHPDRWWNELQLSAVIPGLFQSPIHVLRVPDPLPRAYAVSGARVGANVERFVTDPAFDHRREVVLAEGQDSLPEPGFTASTRIVELRPDQVIVEAELSHPGYVVLVETYDPGWSVRVDGRPASLLRANGSFRAVRVPAGHSRIEQRYRPRTLALGLGAAALAAVLTAAMAAAELCWPAPEAPESGR